MIRSLVAWGPAVIWAAVLFFLSAREFSGPDTFPVNDKVVHFGLYAVLGAALAFARARSARSPGALVLLGCGLLYGISDEFHQSFVPDRTPSLGDVVADAVGLAAGFGVAAALLGRGTKPGPNGS